MPEPPLTVQITRAYALLKRARIEGNGAEITHYLWRVNKLLDQFSRERKQQLQPQ